MGRWSDGKAKGAVPETMVDQLSWIVVILTSFSVIAGEPYIKSILAEPPVEDMNLPGQNLTRLSS